MLFYKKYIKKYENQFVVGVVTPEDKCDGGNLEQIVVVHQLAD